MKTKKSHLSDTKAARLHNGGIIVEDAKSNKVDGTVSEQVKNLRCINAWLQICKERENTKNIQKSTKN